MRDLVGHGKAGNAIVSAGALVESKARIPVGEFVVRDLELQLAVFVRGNSPPDDRSLDHISGFNAIFRTIQLFKNCVVRRGAAWAVPRGDGEISLSANRSCAPHDFVACRILRRGPQTNLHLGPSCGACDADRRLCGLIRLPGSGQQGQCVAKLSRFRRRRCITRNGGNAGNMTVAFPPAERLVPVNAGCPGSDPAAALGDERFGLREIGCVAVGMRRKTSGSRAEHQRGNHNRRRAVEKTRRSNGSVPKCFDISPAKELHRASVSGQRPHSRGLDR
jgi:hypothetical protein